MRNQVSQTITQKPSNTPRFYGLLTITQILLTIKQKNLSRPQSSFHVIYGTASILL